MYLYQQLPYQPGTQARSCHQAFIDLLPGLQKGRPAWALDLHPAWKASSSRSSLGYLYYSFGEVSIRFCLCPFYCISSFGLGPDGLELTKTRRAQE